MTASARFFRLARSLLVLLQSFVRTAFVLLLVPHISACVLPIAPDFQDPPASENFAPIITDSSPALGSIVTAIGGVLPTFRVTISDPNLGDDLHVRWLADYPMYSVNTRTLVNDFLVPHSTNGQPLKQDVSVTNLDCVTYNLAPIAQHQLMVMVADRPFTNPIPQNHNFASVDAPGLVTVGSWVFNLDCGSP